MYNIKKPAKLILSNGKVFQGFAFGKTGTTLGEVCFNTGMTGYQEILTDPSYCGQMVTMTYPHIGNYGINNEDVESNKIQVSGFIVKENSPIYSNFRATDSLTNYLNLNNMNQMLDFFKYPFRPHKTVFKILALFKLSIWHTMWHRLYLSQGGEITSPIHVLIVQGNDL